MTLKYENAVAHFDFTVTRIARLFKWQAIIICHQPGTLLVWSDSVLENKEKSVKCIIRNINMH